MVTLSHYLVLSAVLFVLGVLGVLLRRNAITMLMSIELMLNAANLAFIAAARHYADLDGQLFAFFVMAVAAAEAAVGLALIIAIFRLRETCQVDELNLLRDCDPAEECPGP